MNLEYNGKKIDVIICNSFIKRLKGIMFKRQKINCAFIFFKCNSIHTFFCFQNIDVIMTDKNNKIVFFETNVGKNRVIVNKNGVNTIETPNNYFKDLKIGKYIEMSDQQ